MSRFVFFDVGSHNGYEFFELARQNPDTVVVYAFEPTPWAAKDIENKVAFMNNFHVIQAAVAETDGTATLNISAGDQHRNDSGCNSLHQFVPGDTPWFQTVEQVEVPTIRLDTFLSQHPEIGTINFLHVDAQGEDLNVLKSLGDRKDVVLEGVVELATNKSNTIYQNNPDIVEGLSWMHANGFLAVRIDPNDPPGGTCTTEHNVRFVRAGTENPVTLTKYRFTDAYSIVEKET